jgi:hypothetical protein
MPKHSKRKESKVETPRVQLSFRITPYLKKRITEAALANGRSQSQEAEFRLEYSFWKGHYGP